MDTSRNCLQPPSNNQCDSNEILKAICESKCNLEYRKATDGQSKAETDSFRIQLEIERLEKCHKFCIDEIVENFNKLSEKCKETSDKILYAQKDSKDLEQTKCSKICEVKKIENEIKMLELYLTQNIECNEKLEKNLKEKQGYTKLLKRTMLTLENSIACKTAEFENSRCQLTDAEISLDKENAKLHDLLQRDAENAQKIEKLAPAQRELEAKLATLRETGPVQMDLANEYADAARVQLADACVALADWNTKCEHAKENCRELRMKNEEETCFARIEIKNLYDERDRLNIEICDGLDRLKTLECDNRRPYALIKEKTEQLKNMTNEVKKLERKIAHERSVQAQLRAKRHVVTKVIEDEATVDRLRLSVIENEMKALRQTYERS